MKRLALPVLVVLLLISAPAAGMEAEIEPGFKLIYENFQGASHKICGYIEESAADKYPRIENFMVQGFILDRSILETQVYLKTRNRVRENINADLKESTWLNLYEQVGGYEFNWVRKYYGTTDVFVPEIAKNARMLQLTGFAKDFFRQKKLRNFKPDYAGSAAESSFAIEVPVSQLVDVLWTEYVTPMNRDVCGVCVVIRHDKYEVPDFFVMYSAAPEYYNDPYAEEKYLAAEIINGGRNIITHEDNIHQFVEEVYSTTLAVEWPRVYDADYYRVRLYLDGNCSRFSHEKLFNDPDSATFWADLNPEQHYSWTVEYSNDRVIWMPHSDCRMIDMKELNLIPPPDTSTWRDHNRRGVKYFSEGDYTRALMEFLTSLRMEPSESVNFNNVGLIYEMNGDFNLAEEYYRKAISLNPANAEAHNNLGFICYRYNQLACAIHEWEVVNELIPGNEDVWNNLQYARSKAARLGNTSRLHRSYFFSTH